MRMWKNGNGLTDTIRDHLRNDHSLVWRDTCVKMKLKGWETHGLERSQSELGEVGYKPEEFSITGVLDRLVRWVVTDDQVRSKST